MTTTVLNLHSSLFGLGGASSQLNQKVIATLAEHLGPLNVLERDLVREPLPYFDADFIGALGQTEADRDTAQRSRVALADRLIEELERADILVIAAPMYNFGVPAQLKTWMDYVARAGRTFRYTESGSEGLLADRPVYICSTRGGQHVGQTSDTETPFLKTFFSFLGLTDLRFVFAEGLNMGLRAQSFDRAHHTIDQWVKHYA